MIILSSSSLAHVVAWGEVVHMDYTWSSTKWITTTYNTNIVNAFMTVLTFHIKVKI